MNIGMKYDDYDFLIGRKKVDFSVSMNRYHYHNYYEVYYLYSGERYYFIKDKTYLIKKGTLVLINEYDIHCVKETDKVGYDRILLNFNKDFLGKYSKSVDFNPYECFEKGIHIIQLDEKEQSFIECVLFKMLDEFNDKKKNYMDFIKANIIQILLLANRHIHDSIVTPTIDMNSTNKTISNIIGYINNNYYEDISLESISKKFFISPCYFSRTFKKETNYSFVDYLNNVRIKAAQELLGVTDMNITEVSEQVGYKNSTHFGRIFKKITGISPMAYKKQRPQ